MEPQKEYKKSSLQPYTNKKRSNYAMNVLLYFHEIAATDKYFINNNINDVLQTLQKTQQI